MTISDDSDAEQEVMIPAPQGYPRRRAGESWLLEFFMRRRVGPCFESLGGPRCSLSLDLLHGWNADLWEDRSALLQWIRSGEPEVAIGCPPCRMFSQLQQSNKNRIPRARWDDMMAQATIYLDFSMFVFHLQCEAHRGFAFEHPAGAGSWREDSVQFIMSKIGVTTVTFDQCRFGLRHPNGQQLLHKRTRIMTNMAPLQIEFENKLCTCTEPHAQISGAYEGRRVSRHSEVYPPLMAAALARGAASYIAMR